jgi:hypothetical protein
VLSCDCLIPTDDILTLVSIGFIKEIDQRFSGAYCLHYQGDEAASTPETLGNFYKAQQSRRQLSS